MISVRSLAAASIVAVCSLGAVSTPNTISAARHHASAAQSKLQAIAKLSSTDVWAVGDYIVNDFPHGALVVHWAGAKWSPVATPDKNSMGTGLTAVSAVSSNDIWAAGYTGMNTAETHSKTLVERWDGHKWKIVSTPTVDGAFYGVSALSSKDIWAVGLQHASGKTVPLVERYDGSKWTKVSSPSVVGGLYGVAARSDKQAWAVGYQATSSGADNMLIERWNGKAWSVQSVTGYQGKPAGGLYGIAVRRKNDVWAVGADFNNGSCAAEIEHWNGSSWTPNPLHGSKPGAGCLRTAVALSASNVWVGGYDPGVVYAPDRALLSDWNGSKWTTTIQTQHNGDRYVTGMAAIGKSDVWAAGYYHDAKGNSHALTEHWNGSKWVVVKVPV